MAGEDEREPEAGKGEMPIPRRRAGGRKLQRRSSPRQCCLEDKAQGAYSTQERTAPCGCPEDKRGKGYRCRYPRDMKGGCRYLRDINKEESSIKQCSFSEISLERTLELQTPAERSSNSEQSRGDK